MNKKVFCLAAALGLAGVAGLAATNASRSIARANEGEVIWNHYAATKATASSNGSLEYWISCADHTVSFSAPESSNAKVVEATHEDGWLGTLENSDSRLTAYTPNAFKSEGAFWRYFRHSGWGSSDFGNGVVQIKTGATITYKLLQDAHELGIPYLYFKATGIGKTETITSLPIVAENTTGKFSNGQPWMQETSQYGIGYIIDVENWYSTFTGNKTDENVTAFNIGARNKDNGSAEIDTLTFSSFETFDTSEKAEAFKKIDTIFATNGWDYFRRGALPTYDGTKFVWDTGDKATIIITNNVISAVKALGKTKFSFNVKMSAVDTSVNLSHYVYTSQYVGGTNAAGEAVKWSTDYAEGDVTDFANEGVRITLDVSKFFDDTVTYDDNINAYLIQGRVANADDAYQGATSVTVSDISVE